MNPCARIMIAGTKSGCGKTTAVCGILRYLQKRGEKLFAWKSGPDYIDPLFHERVLGIAGGNLDGFFCEKEMLCSFISQKGHGYSFQLIEGAMGYYDGIGMTDNASCYHLARETQTPVILLVDGKGMGNSFLALLKGFLTYRNPSGICGVIVNRISARQYDRLKPYIEDMGVSALGYIPVQKEFTMESRHLGLITAGELVDIEEKIDRFADILADTIDWEKLRQIAEKVNPPKVSAVSTPWINETKCEYAGVTMAIAKDEAFCFLYGDNIRYLEQKGIRLTFFSPLHDTCIPEGIDALWIPGGYPEIYGAGLSANTSMKKSILDAILSGMPYLAECGGFMYLMEEIEDLAGKRYPMIGIYPGCARKGNFLKRFGYVNGESTANIYGQQKLQIRAHEFHYFSNEEPGEIFQMVKASGEGKWMTGYGDDHSYAGFPHIYFYGNPKFTDAFLQRAFAWHKTHGELKNV